MGYREKIPPDRLKEFKNDGESGVQAKLDAGLYSGRHQDAAILFIKLCESEREPGEQTLEPLSHWQQKWWGKVIIGVLIVVFGWGVVALIRYLLALN